MSGLLDRIYASSPVWFQGVAISAFGMVWKRRRFAGRFQEAVREFISRDYNSPEQWRRYQTDELRRLLKHAGEFVPYYQEIFRELGITIGALAEFELEDLSQFPLLEKEMIRRNLDRFTARNVNGKKLHTYLSSGTTGTPLAIKFTSEMHQTWSGAYEVRCRRWAGVNWKMSRATIGGRIVVPKAESKPPFWRYNLAERQLYMSAFHISPKNVPCYVEALNRFRPDYLVGYASSHFFLARMIFEMELKVHRPRAVLTSSEKLTEEMRSIIEQAYRCPVFDAYSGVEACCLASECEHHQLHISPDVGIIELLDENGKPVSLGQVGEIVATGLLNFAQPLIRYRTGDLALLSNQACPCGRSMPILQELVGRLEDTVIGPDGRETVRFHGIFVGLPHVREGQVIQETLSRFRLRLVVDPEFSDDERAIIHKRFEERLGPIDLTFEFVDWIERTERGKFRAVISKVKRVQPRLHAALR